MIGEPSLKLGLMPLVVDYQPDDVSARAGIIHPYLAPPLTSFAPPAGSCNSFSGREQAH